MQFQVPQFIETEDKIVGPLTFRQFAIVAAFAIAAILLFFVLPLPLWLVVAGILGALAMGLAFGQINGRPATVYLGAIYGSIWKPNVYVFKPTIPAHELPQTPTLPKEEKAKGSAEERRATPIKVKLPSLPKPPSFGGLKELREWVATSKTAIPKREKPLPKDFGMVTRRFKDRYEVVRYLTGERELAKRVDYRQ